MTDMPKQSGLYLIIVVSLTELRSFFLKRRRLTGKSLRHCLKVLRLKVMYNMIPGMAMYLIFCMGIVYYAQNFLQTFDIFGNTYGGGRDTIIT